MVYAAQMQPDEIAAMTTDEHANAFLAYVAGLLGDFDRYAATQPEDPVTDGTGYRVAAMRLTDAELARLPRLMQDLDVPVRSMHADPLPIPDQPGGMLHPHDGRQAVLPCDHRAMGHQAPHLRHQALDRDERRRPAGVRVGGDQDVARFEIGLAPCPG